jgi:hypothetical protein
MVRRALSFIVAGILIGIGGSVRSAHATQPLQRAESPPPDSSVYGVVWTPPEANGPALRQLAQIDALGATAVRLTRLPPTGRLVSRADSLEIALFVDLPVSYVSTASLDDSLRATRPELEKLRRWADQYEALRAIGLAHGANTTRPATCSVLETWTDRLHRWDSPPRTYYVTPFAVEADRCAHAVDRVLLDTRGRRAPMERLGAWRASGAAIGVGALGAWVRPAADRGLRVPHSPERQARHLERALGTLLDSTRASPPIFVYRWQDRSGSPLPTRRYGIRVHDDSSRPAARVVEGFYRGSQRVFAFPDGRAPSRTPLGPLLLAWTIIALLGGLYARNPFVRQTVVRYFAAPGFYRDAVRTGREVRPSENLLLLGVVGGAIGIIGTLVARMAAPPAATGFVVEALPPAVATPLASGLSHPAGAGAVVGSLAVGLLAGWALLLVGVARSEGPFTVAQGLMLVTWPCWPAVLGMLIALVAAIDPPFSPALLGAILVGGGLATSLAATARVLRDFWRVSGVDTPWMVLLSLLNPLVVGTAFLVVVGLEYDLPLQLLWHLLTRT